MELWLRWSERRWHLKYKLQGDKRWVHETPEHRHRRHQETGVQNDSDHTQRKHRVRVNMWKGLHTSSRGHTRASWPSVSHDRYSTACAWLRGGAARHCSQEAQPMGLREFGLRSNTHATDGQGCLTCPENRDSLETWQRCWDRMQMVNILLFYSFHPKPRHHVSQLSPRFSS